VNDLLDLTRLQAGKLKLLSRPLRVARVVQHAVEAARPAALAKGLELSSTLEAASADVWGDEDRLRQLAGNLLANAIKFTDKGGHIQVLLRARPGELELEVADTGTGIAPERLESICAGPCVPRSTTHRPQGLGVGLALVREIAALHGGSVHASSPGLGRGATFCVRLPLLHLGQPPAHREPQLAGLSILVVDDEADARAVVAASLQLEGAAVRASESARGALAELSAPGAHFDIVITDIGMPVEDGYSLLRRLRASRAGAGIIAIALTGYARPADRASALRAGFEAHVAKPVDFDEFVPLIARLARGETC
jgi:CheY-like chemotaxis protein